MNIGMHVQDATAAEADQQQPECGAGQQHGREPAAAPGAEAGLLQRRRGRLLHRAQPPGSRQHAAALFFIPALPRPQAHPLPGRHCVRCRAIARPRSQH